MDMNVLSKSHLQKRDLLIEVCARQRQQVAVCIHQIQQPLQMVELALNMCSLLKKYRYFLLTVLVVAEQKQRKWLMHSCIEYTMTAMIKLASSSSWFAQLQVFIQTISHVRNHRE